jgi:Cu+-exporting ATPase
VVEGEEVLIGNQPFLAGYSIAVPQEAEDRIAALQDEGRPLSWSPPAGGSRASSPSPTPSSRRRRAPSRTLKKMGLAVAMITGDNPRTANAIARQIGIEDVHAGVLPQEKAQEVRALQERGRSWRSWATGSTTPRRSRRRMSGSLSGAGPTSPSKSGDIVLIRDDLTDAVAAVELSRKVMSRIKQNLFWAFAYNSALIPLAAGVLYPFFGITFRPELAALAMALSSVTVVSLSLLLKTYIPPAKRGVTIGG